MTTKADKKAIFSWMLFDWAGQPFHTLLVTFIFAPYFAAYVVGDPVQGQIQWATMMAIAGLFVAILSPLLGAIADTIGPRKPWMALFAALFVLGSFPLWIATPNMDNTTLVLFIMGVGFVGVTFCEVFANAMLPELGEREDMGKLSGSGYALGYIGGLIALFLMLLLFQAGGNGKTLIGLDPLFGLDPVTKEGTRIVGPLVAIWFVVFMIPFFKWVPDVQKTNLRSGAASDAIKQLFVTLKNLPSNTSLFSYLGSSMFYRDALNGTYAFGGIYAIGVLDWSITQVGIFGIIGGLTAVIFSYFGGKLDGKIGPKKVVIISVIILIFACMLLVGTSRETFFGAVLADTSTLPDKILMFCGALIGGAGGMLQSASRTLMIFQANKERMTEAFGLYALSGRASAWLAPGLIALFTELTQSQRLGIMPVILLFLIGLVLLVWVKPGAEYE